MTDMEQKLSNLYWSDPKKYKEEIQNIKALGIKIYRNNKGEHRIPTANTLDYLKKLNEQKIEEAFFKGLFGL